MSDEIPRNVETDPEWGWILATTILNSNIIRGEKKKEISVLMYTVCEVYI